MTRRSAFDPQETNCHAVLAQPVQDEWRRFGKLSSNPVYVSSPAAGWRISSLKVLKKPLSVSDNFAG
jgi:hypothetical protein